MNLTRNSANVTGVAIASAIVTGVMVSQGFDTEIEDVIDAGLGSELLGAFMTGLRVVYVVMAGLALVGAIASFFKPAEASVGVAGPNKDVVGVDDV